MEAYKTIECKCSPESTSVHELFVKEHKVRNHTKDKPEGRTLFVLNIPPYATRENFKRAFSTVGKVTSVQFYDSPENLSQESKGLGFKVGFIVYEKMTDLQKALCSKQLPPLMDTTDPKYFGIIRWAMDYNASIISKEKLAQQCQMIVAKYDKEQLRASKNKRVVDEEGWTVVTGKGKRAGVRRTESAQTKLNKKLKHKGVKNFYTFQIKEEKMQKIVELRKKMEENKKRLEAIRKQRKFKPFS